ncbi:MAG: hypothetical protein S4CHLAM123_09890 [Chlamydiales bacterium]|nr:hypothetical protein [Chlamydiales bacterium]
MLISSQLSQEEETYDELRIFFSHLDGVEEYLDEKVTLLEKVHLDMESSVNQFTEVMENMPLIAIAQIWVKDLIKRHSCMRDDINRFKVLYQKELIPLKSCTGSSFTVNDLRKIGHTEIIENIRSVQALSVLQKEQLVSIYSDFASYISKLTFGFLESPKDPDKEKVTHRLISLDSFHEFSSFLSERNSLIAAIMYFTGRPLNQVVSLKIQDLDADQQNIAFHNAQTHLPRHLSKSLQEYVRGRQPASLLFVNRQGNEVNRTHLFLAFKKASQKMSHPIHITPQSLIASSKY